MFAWYLMSLISFAREKPSWCKLSSKIIWESPHFRLFWKEHLTFYIYSWLRLCRDKWVENDLKMHMCSKSGAVLCCNVLCCMTNFVLWYFTYTCGQGSEQAPETWGHSQVWCLELAPITALLAVDLYLFLVYFFFLFLCSRKLLIT